MECSGYIDTKNEIEEINKIIEKPCKISIIREGVLARTGFKLNVTISLEKEEKYGYNTVSSFYLTQFPGNCGILISHETYQCSIYQRKGLSVPVQKIKEKLAHYYDYTILLATTIPTNYADKSLEQAGYVKLPTLCFKNNRTGNMITTWIKYLTTKEKFVGL